MKRIEKNGKLFINCGVLLSCILFPQVIFSHFAIAAETARPPDLVILYTGEGRGNIEPSGCCSMIGGMARRATKIKEFREEHESVLVVDVGDFLWKEPGDNLHLLKAKHVYNGLVAAGYDALNIADGEIASDEAFLRYFMKNGGSSLLSANVKQLKVEQGRWPPYIIKRFDKLSAAVIGLTDPALVNDHSNNAFSMEDPAEILAGYLPELKKKTDIIILLSHLGWRKSRYLVKSLPDIDIVIVGHDSYHEFEPERIGKTLMVKNEAGGGLLGVIEVWRNPDASGYTMKSRLDVLVEEIQPLPEYVKLEDDFKKERLAYARKMHEVDIREEMSFYLKMTPQEFLEQMRKENRLLSHEELLKRLKGGVSPQIIQNRPSMD